ncbi:hypothetical protein [Photobacterium kishitanii]|uniref:Uncharacterized protein n=1 Tax=Photobacterium kishitanii TaxID=318456 RepID=A0A2T3KN66_9GAMM|nr:hypothetical protein [Photobacterium kishitanii]PSV01185.1 hypothetical protein C9J27_03945 [Photobacterium kishitanii]
MELFDVETSGDAKYLLSQENFWAVSGDDAMFFTVDAYYIVVILCLSFWITYSTVIFALCSFIALSCLKKIDITIAEFLYRIKLRLHGRKYKRVL